MLSMRYGKGHVQKHRRNLTYQPRRIEIACEDELALVASARTNTRHAIGPGHPFYRNQITHWLMQIVYHLVVKLFPQNRKELRAVALQ